MTYSVGRLTDSPIGRHICYADLRFEPETESGLRRQGHGGAGGYIGEKEYGVFRVLKDYFDPDYNMNPGGTIGLDLKPEEKKFLREYTDYLEQPKFD